MIGYTVFLVLLDPQRNEPGLLVQKEVCKYVSVQYMYNTFTVQYSVQYISYLNIVI